MQKLLFPKNVSRETITIMKKHQIPKDHNEWSIHLDNHVKLVDKGSKFIGIAWDINDRSELKDLMQKARLKYPAASHYCYGYQIGFRNTKNQGMSDDGEPKYTAGKPILQVIKNLNITNTIIFVVRYFGGTELGTGGLVRMYTKTTQEVIAKATLIPLTPKVSKHFVIAYEYWNGIEFFLKNSAYQYQANYSDQVTLDMDIPVGDLEIVKKNLISLSHGTIG